MTHHWSQVIENKKFSSSNLSLSGKKNVLIRNCDFTVDKSGIKQCQISNCQDVTIENCKFHDRKTKGQGLNIVGGSTKRVTVKGCEFYNFTYSAANGGEPMRIGNSHSSGCVMDCLITNCYFHDLQADVETISLKSANNTVEFCTHENNKSSIVVRHGGYATIRNCLFKGEGGIRIYGYGNVIENNHFQGNKSSKFPPMTLGAGNVKVDPNWTAVDKPKGKDTGNSHAKYAQINNNKIRNNTYENCSTPLIKYRSGDLKPTNSVLDEPKQGPAKAPAGHKASTGTTPTPPTPTPPTPTPEPTPTPTEEPAKIQCVVCQKEDAILKLSVYVGVNHDSRTKKAMQDLVAELRKTIGAS